MDPSEFEGYLAECRNLTLAAIREIVPRDARSRSSLYDLILDYPLRQAKALRPALCIATCCALGGRLECVLRSAAVLELYHNAFLIHDDVEDGSEQRREAPTLHCKHGIPIAVNVGDAMLALTLQPLLDNMATVGLGKALRILQVMRTVEPGRRDRACAVLRKPRPGAPGSPKRLGASMELGPLLAGLQRQGELTARAAQLIEAATRVSAVETDGAVKTPADVRFLLRSIDASGSVPYAREVARRWALRARNTLRDTADWLSPSVHRDFLERLVGFVIERDH